MFYSVVDLESFHRTASILKIFGLCQAVRRAPEETTEKEEKNTSRRAGEGDTGEELEKKRKRNRENGS